MNAEEARVWFDKNITREKLNRYIDAFSSCAIESNQDAETHLKTLKLIRDGKPLDGGDLICLCSTLRGMEGAK